MKHVRNVMSSLASVVVGCTGARDSLGFDAAAATEAGTDAGVDAGACIKDELTFAMRAMNPTAYCIGAPGTCSAQWLAIFAPGGNAIVIDWPCLPECSRCEPVGCPALCAAPSRMPEAGAERAWDGTYYASGVCGSGLICESLACAAAGMYVARMCAYPDTVGTPHDLYCSPVSTPICVDVPFTWPPPQPKAKVEGWIGVPACCPASWSMVPCTYLDGGAAHNCHNPALGCASSTRCGEGCDRVVPGRCPP